jgi:hypothetical protein
MVAEGRLLVVKLSRHVDVLHALAWEQEDHGPVFRLAVECKDSMRVERFQAPYSILAVTTGKGSAVTENFPAYL